MAFMISYTGIKLNLSDAGIPWVAPQNHSPRADFSFPPNPGDLPFVKSMLVSLMNLFGHINSGRHFRACVPHNMILTNFGRLA